MKILIINTSYGSGGAAKTARTIFNKLNNSSEFSACFAYGRQPVTSNKNTFKFTSLIENTVDALIVRATGIEGSGTAFATKKLIKHIKKEKYDLIHIHNMHGYYLNYYKLIPFLKQNNDRVIWTLHDEWSLTWLPGYSTGCSHCRTGSGTCTNIYTYPGTYNYTFTASILKRKQSVLKNWSPTIVCPSQDLADQVMGSYLKNQDIQVIHNGIDTELFRPARDKRKLRTRYNLPADKKIILVSSADIRNKIKGIKFVLDIIDYFDPDKFVFLIIGKGCFNTKNTINYGFVNNEQEMSDLYASSDIYCFPSLAEICPFSVLESMACGLPVIGFDIKPLREIICNDNGILVETKNTQKLYSSIKLILENEKTLHNFSRAARNHIVSNFSINIMIKKY
ncbi:MAG: glycosyltransferase, partial [bacterium]|nr:glycosyltransferase [bacterium]